MTTGVEIYLPKGCTSIDTWKVKVGSSVRQGEVLAVASAMTQTKKTDPSSTSTSTAATSAAHKRPRPKLKPKGLIPNPYTASTSSTGSSATTGSSSSSSATATATATATAGAARLDSRNEPTNQPNHNVTGMGDTSGDMGGDIDASTVFVLEEVLVRAPAPGFLVSQWSNAELQEARSKYTSTATSSISIGRIEPCRHPTVLGNLCAVCGMTTTTTTPNHTNNNVNHTAHHYNNGTNRNRSSSTTTTTATDIARLHRPKPRPRKPLLTASKHTSLISKSTLNNNGSAALTSNTSTATVSASATTANNGSSLTSRSGGEGFKSSSFSSLVQRVQQQQQQQPQQKSKQQPSSRTNPLKLSELLRTAGGANSNSRQGEDHNDNHSDATNTNNNNNDMTHVTVSGGVTMKVSSEEAMSFARQTTARLRNARKLSLVLDLDHTLLHAIAASQDPNTNRIWMEQEDVRTLSLPVEVLPIPPTSTSTSTAAPASVAKLAILMMRHYVKLRPHLTEFLQEAMNGYEISVYTAGTRTYANEVTQLICRHMVGAKVDDYEEWMAYMRERLKETQDVLQKAKKQGQSQSTGTTKKTKRITKPRSTVTATAGATTPDAKIDLLLTLGKIPKKKKTAQPLLNNHGMNNKNRTTSSDEKKADEDIEEAMVKLETSKDVDVGVTTTVGEDASKKKGGTDERKRKRVSFEASVNEDLEERAQRYKELIKKSTEE
eukprot:scaffold69588_cov48-Attheya_sp.AAC.3